MDVPSPHIETSATPTHREHIRQQIRPFERRVKPEPAYPTKWGEELSFSDIMQNQDVLNVAYAKTLRLGLQGEDQEECVQRGFIKLWQKLQDEPTMLANRGQGWVGIYVALSGAAYQIHRDNRRNRPPETQNTDWNLTEEYITIGLKQYNGEKYAGWTREIDEQIDIARFMGIMAERYANNMKELLAMYAYTTSATVKDVAPILNLDSRNFSATLGKLVRKELQEAAISYFDLPIRPKWEECLKRGEQLEHITHIAERIMDNQRLLLALYVVTTCVKRKDVAQVFGMGLTCFCREINEIKTLIAKEYNLKSE